mmetsp:Transcript_48071/g.112351  ORF Transcript_48071/g.112351 Transcript_48071/m.112351 type:complete len:745 (-) Transcript_48071:80-2314(-)
MEEGNGAHRGNSSTDPGKVRASRASQRAPHSASTLVLDESALSVAAKINESSQTSARYSIPEATTSSTLVGLVEFGVNRFSGSRDSGEYNSTHSTLKGSLATSDLLGEEALLEPPVGEDVSKLGSAPRMRMLWIALPEWVPLSIGLVCIFISMGSELLQPLLYGKCVEVILDWSKSLDEKIQEINNFMLILIGFLVLASVLRAVRGYLFGLASNRAILKLRRGLFESILTQETAFFDCMKSGALSSRIMSDTGTIGSVLSGAVPDLVSGSVKLIGCLSLLMYTDWQMTCLIFLVIPAMVAVIAPFVIMMAKISVKAQEAVTKAAVTTQEAIANIRTVRSFAAEKLELARFLHIIGNPCTKCFTPARDGSVFRLNMVRNVTQIVMSESATMLVFGAVYCVQWYGFLGVAKGESSLADVFVFLQLTYMLMNGLGAVAGAFPMLSSIHGSSLRVFQLLTRAPRMEPGGRGIGTVIDKLRGEITFEKVQFAYPTRPQTQVLQGLAFQIPANTLAAFVGSSGGGKSTVLGLIARFYDPFAGRVLIDGVDLKSLDAAWLRLSIGIVQQEPALFGMSIRDNICYGQAAKTAVTGALDEAPMEDVEHAARMANAHDFVTNFPSGYSTVLGERGMTLSGGQKQRIAIARAILLSPKVLLLDEATSALDAEAEALVQEAIDRMVLGRTTIAVAHRLSTVRNADQIFVLKDGRLESQGLHSQLLRSCATYKQLARRQTHARDGREPNIYEEPVIV